jgi:tRNA nucleotidyltransferase (CCA-adding enzyme)
VEDPVRVLRGARFAARFGFAIAPDTLELMREMARNGEVDALVPERVWQELARGLMEPHPLEMFRVLDMCGALDKALPELTPFHAAAPNMAALQKAATLGLSLPVRFAALTGCVDAAHLALLVERVRVPNDCRDLARLYLRHARELADAAALDASALAELILGADGLRQEARFEALIAVAHLYCTKTDERVKQGTSRLLAAHTAARAVDAGAVARQHSDAQAIAAAVRAARVAAIARAIGVPAA